MKVVAGTTPRTQVHLRPVNTNIFGLHGTDMAGILTLVTRRQNSKSNGHAKTSPELARALGPLPATVGHGDRRVGIRRPIFRSGYVMEWVDGRYVYQHRLVMAQILGRPLARSEVVHHIDHDRTNNAPENLELLADHKAHRERHVAEGSGGWPKGKPKPWQAKVMVPCPVCGEMFKPKRRDRRDTTCCSQSCGQKWRYRDAPHGANRYMRGCRCNECRAAWAKKMREYRRRQ